LHSEGISLRNTIFGIFSSHSQYKCSYKAFSVINPVWTNEENRFFIETIKLVSDKNLFSATTLMIWFQIAARSSQKYKTCPQEDEVTPSISEDNVTVERHL
jgi:hypothetical protein